MERVLEPEMMDTAEEATAYDAMDHSAPNLAFVERLRALGASGHMLDIGTGPAHIPLLIASLDPEARVTAIDAADHMLHVAKKNLRSSPVGARVTLAKADAKRLHFPDHSFDAVFSNTILHHIPDPRSFLKEAHRVLKPGGTLLIRDLFRPTSEARRDELVELHAKDASPAQKELFRASLQAALTADELRAMVRELGFDDLEVVIDSDRHMSLQSIRSSGRPRLSLAHPGPRDQKSEEDRAPSAPESPRLTRPQGLGPTPVRPPRWSRRSGPAEAEAQRLDRILGRIERSIDGGRPEDEARAMLAEIPEGPFGDPVFHLRAGDVFAELAVFDAAERHYQRALDADPTWSDALHRMALLCIELGRDEEMVELSLRVREADAREPRAPWALSEDDFAAIAEQTVAALPQQMKARMSNLPIVIAELPSEALVQDGIDPRILGVITGVPLPEQQTVGSGGPVLDCIQIFQRNVERVARTKEEVAEEVRITVVHEALHYFGLTDEDLEEIGLG
ncbi:MAG: methyltransferase domain-containing protein [Myxococcota bacterium]